MAKEFAATIVYESAGSEIVIEKFYKTAETAMSDAYDWIHGARDYNKFPVRSFKINHKKSGREIFSYNKKD